MTGGELAGWAIVVGLAVALFAFIAAVAGVRDALIVFVGSAALYSLLFLAGHLIDGGSL